MNPVLVIAASDSTRNTWCQALRARGMQGRQAASLVRAFDHLDDPALAGIVFQSQRDDDLDELVALSSLHALPPVVIVSPTAVPVASRFTAGAVVGASMPFARVVDRLSCLVGCRRLMSPTHLPVRLSPMTDAQWTMRLTARAPYVDDDSFDGATQPDGFELALRA